MGKGQGWFQRQSSVFLGFRFFVQNFHEGFQTGCDLRTYEDHSPENEDPDEEQGNQCEGPVYRMINGKMS